MKAISIRQPEAWLIIQGYKDIENRTWATTRRGWVAVHAASKRMTRDDWEWLRGLCDDNDVTAPTEDEILYGGVIGVVEIVDCVTQHDSPWFEGGFGFVLDNPTPCEFLPCKGKLGWFDVDLEVEE